MLSSENHPHFKVLAASGPSSDDDCIYLALDTILDTRLGTLGKIDPKLAANALDKGYKHRIIDQFEGIKDEDYKSAYASRDIETLKMSTVTNVSFLLRRIIKDSLALAVQQHHLTQINIDVNVWPYDVPEGPLAEMLVMCVRTHAYENAIVRVISCDPKHLSPSDLAVNYQMAVMYDWLEWIEEHKAFFEKKGVPSLTLMVPELCVDRVPTKEELQETHTGEKNIFRMTEKLFAPMIRLNMMPASLFSIIDEITKENVLKKIAVVSLTPEDLERGIKSAAPQALVTRVPVEPHVLDLDAVSKQVDDEDFELL